MELVEGETLAARLRRGMIPLDQALRYAIQIADALAAAHQHGVVHRDLKPANVMLTARGAKLLDFGLAHLHAPADSLERGATTTRLTAVGVVAGTLPYMSPEQLRSEDVDARSDVFAFGALLYEMVTGARPFNGRSSVELMASVLERDTPTLPDSASGPRRALDRLIKNCLVKDRAERWQNARDAALQLRGIEQDLAAPAHVTRPSRRATVAFWLLLAATAFAAGYLLRQRSDVTPPAETMQGRFTLDLRLMSRARFSTRRLHRMAAHWSSPAEANSTHASSLIGSTRENAGILGKHAASGRRAGPPTAGHCSPTRPASFIPSIWPPARVGSFWSWPAGQ